MCFQNECLGPSLNDLCHLLRIAVPTQVRFRHAENAIKPLVFMYYEAFGIFLGSKIAINLAYFWVE